MTFWHKFFLIIGGYGFLDKLSRWLPACRELRYQKDTRSFCLLRKQTLFPLSIMMILGLSMAFFLVTVVHQAPFFLEIEDTVGIDSMMRINRQIIPSAQEKDIHPFVLIDIDNKTHKHWGEPLFTPRNRVQRLIEAAVKGKARLIIVDIDLTRPTPIEGLSLDRKLHPYDENLVKYFEDYPTYCETQTQCAPIILARGFSSLSQSTTRLPYYQPRKAFDELEDAVKNSNGYMIAKPPMSP